MDNQHQKISGYRDLGDDEVYVINSLKDLEDQLGIRLSAIENGLGEHGDKEAGRWLSLARTHLETGMMFAIKAVARPSNGLGRRNPK
ncbi:MAG: DUF7681 family protein [Geminicoccaceae bacterium]